jgi:signal transduction histidine kinase
LFNINARHANITIHIDSSSLTCEKEWNGYPGYLTQIIINLLQNIERYAYPSGQGGKVDIAAADNNDENFIITLRGRMPFTIFSAGSFTGPDFFLIFAP